MSYLLDGSVAAFGFQTDVNAGDVTSATSGVFPTGSTNFDNWTCVANEFMLRETQASIIKTTFCSNRQIARSPGLRDVHGRVGLFESRGYTVSNPGYLFAAVTSVPCIASLDVGCTWMGMIVAASRQVGARAWDNFTGELEFDGDGSKYAWGWLWITG